MRKLFFVVILPNNPQGRVRQRIGCIFYEDLWVFAVAQDKEGLGEKETGGPFYPSLSENLKICWLFAGRSAAKK